MFPFLLHEHTYLKIKQILRLQKCMLMLKADKDLGAVVLLELHLFIQLSTMAGVFLLNI